MIRVALSVAVNQVQDNHVKQHTIENKSESYGSRNDLPTASEQCQRIHQMPSMQHAPSGPTHPSKQDPTLAVD